MTVTLTPIFDEDEDGDEDVVFTVQSTDRYAVGSVDSATVTILDFVQRIFRDSFEIQL